MSDIGPYQQSTGAVGAVVVDVVAPLIAYQALHRFRFSDASALSLAGALPAARALVSAIQHRRVETLALFIVVTFALGIAVTAVTGDSRFLLAKEALFTIPDGRVLCVHALARPAAQLLHRSGVCDTPQFGHDWRMGALVGAVGDVAPTPPHAHERLSADVAG